jgi:hypothetical protein
VGTRCLRRSAAGALACSATFSIGSGCDAERRGRAFPGRAWERGACLSSVLCPLSLFRLSSVLCPLSLFLLALVLLGCSRVPPPPGPGEEPLRPTPGLPWFEDVTAKSGIDFRHHNPATEFHYIEETLGSGLGWIDYDNDGRLDLFCVQDGPVRPGPGAPAPTCKLYRNNGDGTFTDVTAAVGLDRHPGFAMGCAVGDFDNDGFDDLVVTYLGGLVLYHNEPDGHGGRRFVDVTANSGLVDPHFATSCAWGDIDGDGLLDLYVCNYVEIDPEHPQVCEKAGTHIRYSCPPTNYPHTTHKLFRNLGGGKFADVSESSGVASAPPAPGLGVVMLDLDGDGRTDIYAANDMRPAYLFHNQGGGRFVETALLHGCALGPQGHHVAGMGVAAGDVDGSGRPSLFVTNFQEVPNVLYLNRGNLYFQEASFPSGLGFPSLNKLGFGTALIDANLDGTLAVAVANGHVEPTAPEVANAPFEQEPQLFLGDGRGKFREVSREAGPFFREKRVGRGLAWADYDNDGRPDLAYSHNGGPVALLHNATATGHHWLGLALVGDPDRPGPDGRRSSRDAVGARVELKAGGKTQVRWVIGGGSYLSAPDRRLLFGLGDNAAAESVTVHWPSGRVEQLGPLPTDRYHRIEEGRAVGQP